MSKSRETEIKRLNKFREELGEPLSGNIIEQVYVTKGEWGGHSKDASVIHKMALEIKILRLQTKLYGA